MNGTDITYRRAAAVLVPVLLLLAFLATIWLILVLSAELLGESGRKMAMALKGRSLLATVPGARPVAMRLSLRARPQRTLRAQPRFRAAA